MVYYLRPTQGLCLCSKMDSLSLAPCAVSPAGQQMQQKVSSLQLQLGCVRLDYLQMHWGLHGGARLEDRQTSYLTVALCQGRELSNFEMQWYFYKWSRCVFFHLNLSFLLILRLVVVITTDPLSLNSTPRPESHTSTSRSWSHSNNVVKENQF